MYREYSQPLEILNIWVENGFLECVAEMYETKNDNRLFSLYLACQSDKPYDQWKKQAIRQTANTQGVKEEDMDTIVKNSQSILKGFKPNKVANEIS